MKTQPLRGQSIYRNKKLVGTVDHIDGSICYYKDNNNVIESFIWWFSSDNAPNKIFKFDNNQQE